MSRRRWITVVAVAVIAFGGFVIVWFQPQKLILDTRVDEVVVTPSAPPGAPPSQTVADVARGEFVSLDHETRGSVRVLSGPGGQRVVRLEGLDTSNGPDLYLYLTSNPARGPEARFDDDFVSLGRLKGNQGNQNYDVPPGADLSRLRTVVIWCDRFNSAFGAADLSTAPGAG